MPAPAVPTNAADLEATLNDPVKRKALAEDPKAMAEWAAAYATAVATKDPGIADQVQTELIETQRALVNLIKEFGDVNNRRVNFAELNNEMGARLNGAAGNRFYNGSAAGAKIDEQKLFKNTQEYLAATWMGNPDPEMQEKRRELTKIRNDYGSTVPADGGFLVPETLRAELLRVSLETAVVRSRARTIPMDSLRVPFPTIDSISNASNVYGGVTAYWTEESAAMTESQAKFGKVVLEANKLTAYAEIPNELMQDSLISFAAFVDQIYPEALAWFEDKAFFSGSGTGEPLGFLNANAAVSVAAESGQPATSIVWENLVNMFSRMLPASLGRAVWVANLDTFPQLATMALSVGTGGAPVWLNNGIEGPPMTILGRPVVFTEKCPTLGSAGDINFVDFGYYLIGDRQAMTAMTSDHFKFQNDQLATRFIQRVDGRPWLQNAITPNVSASTLTPFVKIAAR